MRNLQSNRRRKHQLGDYLEQRTIKMTFVCVEHQLSCRRFSNESNTPPRCSKCQKEMENYGFIHRLPSSRRKWKVIYFPNTTMIKIIK